MVLPMGRGKIKHEIKKEKRYFRLRDNARRRE